MTRKLPQPEPLHRRRLVAWAIALGLFALTLLVYRPVLRHDFINYDDPDYVVDNLQVQAGLTWQNVAWAFTAHHAANWHPLTWLSHMIDVQCFGPNPGAHHVVSAFIHALNAALLFVVLRCLTEATGRSAFVAALLALHPVHIESVAWISERKDVLSMFFFLLTLWAYWKYARTSVPAAASEAPAPRRVAARWGWYATSLVLFACGLMSKPMLVTLPFVLLLIDYWPLSRLQLKGSSTAAPRSLALLILEKVIPQSLAKTASSGRARSPSGPLGGGRLGEATLALTVGLLEKLPFFALSVASSAATYLVQQSAGGVASLGRLPLGLRFSNAIVSYVRYLGKLVWPTDLSVIYPYASFSVETTALAGLLLVVISGLVLWQSRRRPFLLVGWLWFLGTLVPVIGLVHAGAQSIADRYLYIPAIGVYLAVAWLVADLTRRWPYRRAALASASVTVLAALMWLTELNLPAWRDSETLFRQALAVTTNNGVAHLALGRDLLRQERYDEAADHLREGVRLKPDSASALTDFGLALTLQHKLDDAIAAFRQSLNLDPGLDRTHFLLGSALNTKGLRADAIEQYRAALKAHPDWPLPLNDLAWLLATAPEPALRNGTEAVTLANRACQLTRFQEPQYLGTLAAAYAEAGQFQNAVQTAERARDLATTSNQPRIVQRNEELLQLYRAGKPFRETE